ncbi:MAG: hypothetical protein V4568_12895 [Pseudomonadota bacterium]
MHAPLTGELAWYATGRFYVATNKFVHDVGYFLHLQGIEGNLFNGAPSEATAYFTFAAAPFLSQTVANADVTLSLGPIGKFSLFFNPQAGGNFSNPASFSKGQEIAVFQRVSVVTTMTIAQLQPGNESNGIMSNVFSAKLIESREFKFNGQRYDLKNLLPNGITQWGTASARPTEAPPPYVSAFPFVGSAIAVGGRATVK